MGVSLYICVCVCKFGVGMGTTEYGYDCVWVRLCMGTSGYGYDTCVRKVSGRVSGSFLRQVLFKPRHNQ
jgi:hypothetical protein